MQLATVAAAGLAWFAANTVGFRATATEVAPQPPAPGEILKQCDPPMAPPTTPPTRLIDPVTPVGASTSEADKARRCNVSQLAVAVRSNGILRNIYRENPSDDQYPIPDNGPESQALIDQCRGYASAQGIEKGRVKKRLSDAEQGACYVRPVIEELRRRVLAAAQEHAAAYVRDSSGRAPVPVQILLFGHGGLVSQDSAVYGAEALAPKMMADGYIPVFLVWNNDLFTAYGDYLCCVTDGSIDPDWVSNQRFLIPARLIADIGAGIAYAPLRFQQQITRFWHSQSGDYDLYYLIDDNLDEDCPYFGEQAHEEAGKWGDERICNHILFPRFPIEEPDLQKTPGKDKYLLLNGGHHQRLPLTDVIYYPVLPVRMLATNGSQIGASAWDNMLRRTRLAFDNETYKNESCVEATRPNLSIQRIDQPISCQDGGFARFFNEFKSLLEPYRVGRNNYAVRVKLGDNDVFVPIYLEYYGHSMGAILGDEVLSHYPRLPWKRVVYMAAADTIRDFRDKAGPTIASEDIPFYNLTLHPLTEAREKEANGLVPEGSLLEWIDEMFNGPRTADDRTMGKWKNFESTLPTWNPALLKHVAVRVFPAQNNLANIVDGPEASLYSEQCDRPPSAAPPAPTCFPLMHGDFTKFTFWRPWFYAGAETAPDIQHSASAN